MCVFLKYSGLSHAFTSGGGGGNFGTCVRASFFKLTHIVYLVFEKMTYSYTWIERHIHILFFDFFLYSLFAVCNQSLQILQF